MQAGIVKGRWGVNVVYLPVLGLWLILLSSFRGLCSQVCVDPRESRRRPEKLKQKKVE